MLLKPILNHPARGGLMVAEISRKEKTMSHTVADEMFDGLNDGRNRNVSESEGEPMGWHLESPSSTLGPFPVRLIHGELVAIGASRGPFVVYPDTVYLERPTARECGQLPKPQPQTLKQKGWVQPTPHSPESPYTNTETASKKAETIRAKFTGAGPRTKEDQIMWYCGCTTLYPLGAAVAALLSDLPESGYEKP